MRIGIDASRANVPDKTGTEWYAFEVITQLLARHGREHDFVLYTKEPLGPEWPALLPRTRVRVLRWPPRLLWTQIRLAWEMLLHPPDVLFVPAHTIPIIAPSNTVTTLHDIGFERFRDLYSQKYIGPQWLSIFIRIVSLGKYGSSELDYHRWSARLALRKARSIITVSAFSKQEMIDVYHTKAERIVVAPCGYNSEFHPAITPEENVLIREKYSLPDHYILFIGRLEEKKNVAVMLDAYREYRARGGSYSFVLIGKPGHNYAAFQKALHQPGVIELGWVPHEDIPAIMRAARVFLFVTAYEGFGIPILEAMASGVPVITSTTTGSAEVAGQAAITVEYHSTRSIADSIYNLSVSQELRHEYAQKGIQHAQQYNWKRTADIIWDCLLQDV